MTEPNDSYDFAENYVLETIAEQNRGGGLADEYEVLHMETCDCIPLRIVGSSWRHPNYYLTAVKWHEGGLFGGETKGIVATYCKTKY